MGYVVLYRHPNKDKVGFSSGFVKIVSRLSGRPTAKNQIENGKKIIRWQFVLQHHW